MIKALLFDIGGTVLLEESYDLAAGFLSIAEQLNPEATFKSLTSEI